MEKKRKQAVELGRVAVQFLQEQVDEIENDPNLGGHAMAPFDRLYLVMSPYARALVGLAPDSDYVSVAGLGKGAVEDDVITQMYDKYSPEELADVVRAARESRLAEWGEQNFDDDDLAENAHELVESND